MKSVVAAGSDHPFMVEVTVAIELAPKLLTDVSGMLDRAGLSRGEHWSLSAEYDKDLRLCFALSSRMIADLLRSAINIFMRSHDPSTRRDPAALVLEARGKASGSFLRCLRGHIAPKPKLTPQPRPVLDMPREFQNIRDDVFQWA